MTAVGSSWQNAQKDSSNLQFDDSVEHIDEIDRRLMALLAEDARLPVSDLGRRLGLARTTVQSRIERLQKIGAIAGFTLRPGPAARAPIRATVLISIEPRAAPEVLTRLKSLPTVESVHTTSGRVDMIASLSAPSTEALDAALDTIAGAKGVKSSESLIHLSTKLQRSL